MLRFITRRLLMMIPMLLAISLVSYVVMELPPGDYLTTYIMQLQATGQVVQEDQAAALAKQYGLDQPAHIRYIRWLWRMLQGDFGVSLQWQRPVATLIWSRLGLTAAVTFATMLFTWAMAIPIGIYSATKQYSLGDYTATFLGFVGLGVPDFLLALVAIWIGYQYFGANLTGLNSQEFQTAPLSMAKVIDTIKHLWVPILVLGLSGTAGLIRTMRANLLDELRKPYVVTARAKGLKEGRLLRRYPVRVALNPFVSTIGWSLPGLVSGATIVSVVLNIPMNGPLLLSALQSQDMYLAGAFIMLLSVLTIIGTLLSDILLAWLDPRIRYES
ncbi:MAG: ABC transporter permease [Anaerolineae bacterium]|jgi:peptide/nickel transport system permease protein